jgi:hypothetical protein
LKSTTVAEETINAIKATIDNTFFMLFIFKLIFNIYIEIQIYKILYIKMIKFS